MSVSCRLTSEMTALVLTILIFVAAGFTLLVAGLVTGKLIRPVKPSPEKGEVYECGEQPIGTAWVRSVLRGGGSCS